MSLIERLKEIYRLWRSRCPFVRRLEEWRMRRKAREFRIRG
ncbi:hypothetical protein [Thermococcus sp. AM4]|nr:hypothetical protein [Thermococcus sp. AM4]